MARTSCRSASACHGSGRCQKVRSVAQASARSSKAAVRRRGNEAAPRGRLESGIAQLRDRGHVGVVREALRRGDRERPQLPAIHEPAHRLRVAEEALDAAAHQVGHRGARALVRHVRHLDPGAALEELAADGREVAEARRAVLLASNNRGYPANMEVLDKLIAARQKLAVLCGYRNYAEMANEVRMIGTESKQRAFLEDVDRATRDAANKQYADLLAAKRKDYRAAVVKLEALRKEKASCDAELAEIAAELTKLANVV